MVLDHHNSVDVLSKSGEISDILGSALLVLSISTEAFCVMSRSQTSTSLRSTNFHTGGMSSG